MNLSTLPYLVFLTLAVTLSLWFKTPGQRKVLLLIASYSFYATWGFTFLATLIFSNLVNFGLASLLRKKRTTSILWLGLGFNILLLAVFKYLPEVGSFLPAGGTQDLLQTIVMPIGLSFWTFMAMGYLLDVYREDDPELNLVELALFLSFFPSVLSGPINRAGDLIEQLRTELPIRWDNLRTGAKWILVGLFMKLVLANILANGIVGNDDSGVIAGFDKISSGWGAMDVWVLAVAFGFSLYFDFAGYSLIAIGSAKMFGIDLPINFNRPYLVTSISQFWQRWHVSLSFWIRDYVFLPLATAVRKSWWPSAALGLSMVIFGLWHGAKPGFLFWGACHGLLLIGHRTLQAFAKRKSVQVPDVIQKPLGWLLTFLLVSLLWIPFRAETFDQAWMMLQTVFEPSAYRTRILRPNAYIVPFLIVAGYFSISWLAEWCERVNLSAGWRRLGWWLSPVYYGAQLTFIIIYSAQETLFVYFQF